MRHILPSRYWSLALIFGVSFVVNGATASSIPTRSRQSVATSQIFRLEYIPYFDGMSNLPTSPDNWLGGMGTWSNGNRWSSGLPGINSDVFIATGSDVVTLDTSANINSLTLGGSSGSSTLTDPGDGNTYVLHLSGSLTINQTGGLRLGGADSIVANATSSNAGSIDFVGAQLSVNGDFANSGNISMNNSGSGQAAGLSVSGNFANTGSINDLGLDSIGVGGTLTNSGSLGVFAGGAGSLNNSGSLSASHFGVSHDAVNSGSITIYDFEQGGTLDVAGTLTNTSIGRIQAFGSVALSAGNLANSGTVQLGGNAYLTISNNVTNSGMIIANSQGNFPNHISVAGRFTNNVGGMLQLLGAGDTATIANVINLGTISVGTGAVLTVPPGSHAIGNSLSGFLNAGSLLIASGGKVSSPARYTQTTGSTTVDGLLSGVVNFAGGSVYGNGGTIMGNVTSNAAINIGDAPLTTSFLTFLGNYTQGANGSLTFDIAGSNQYDQLNISGQAHLNGLMTIDLVNAYVPEIGGEFEIMTFAGESGTFSHVAGLPINNSEHFVLEYNSTNLTLEVVAGPLAGISSITNGSGSGEPFAQNYDDGTFLMASNRGGSSPTPEPGSILLFGSGALGSAWRLWRKRKVAP